MKTSVVILLAGSSTRFKSSVKKQFFEIKGKPLFYYAINSFEKVSAIDEIVLVAEKSSIDLLCKSVAKYGFKKVTNIVEGGKFRQNSVFNGLKALDCEDDDIVLIHDGARPLVPEEVIVNSIKEAKKYDAITTAIKVEDTIAGVDNKLVIKDFPNRECLYRIQTPQVFKYSLIMEAHNKYKKEQFTDDAQLINKLGKNVKIVEGSKIMTKITTIEDINFVKEMIENE